MSGICGILNLKEDDFIDKNILFRMGRIMRHRSPDDSGYYVDDRVGLYHNLLKLRASDTKQPIHNENHSIFVILDGIILNYKQLRKNLEKRDHKFYTESDSEVVVHGYESYGEDFIKQLDGIFSIALWDSNKEKMILAVDKFGGNPFFYTVVDNKLLFASEINSLLQFPTIRRTVNLRAFYHRILLGHFIHSPSLYFDPSDTFFQGIKRLPPSTQLNICKGKIEFLDYCKLIPELMNKSELFFIKTIYQYLKEYFKIISSVDAQIGVMLSGGIDSSAIVAMMKEVSDKPINTFTRTYGNEDDEPINDARIVADKFDTNHHELIITSEDVKNLPQAILHSNGHLDFEHETLANYKMYECIEKNKCKISFNGYGAGIVFGRIINDKRSKRIYRSVARIPSKITNKFVLLNSFEYKIYFEILKKLFIPKYLNKCNLNYNLINWCGYLVNKKQLEELIPYKNFIQPSLIILKIPLANNESFINESISSMGHSINSCFPYLYNKLVEFCLKIPTKFTWFAPDYKYLLKKIMKTKLPLETLNKSHRHSSPPHHSWINDNNDIISYFIDELKKRNYFKPRFFNFTTPKKGSSYYFNLLKFELWHKIFIDREKIDRLL